MRFSVNPERRKYTIKKPPNPPNKHRDKLRGDKFVCIVLL